MPAAADGEWLKDPKYLAEATARQLEYAEGVTKHGSMRAAARALGVNFNALYNSLSDLKKKAALRGYAPGHFKDGVAPGYKMGKVTVQRGPAGVERVWERQHPDAAEREAIFNARIDGLRDELPRADPTMAPAIADEDLLTVYPQGDPHAGLYSWALETGAEFDLVEFERINRAAIDRAVCAAPPSQTALFIDLGDSTHADNNANRTPRSQHPLDVHGRHSEVIRVVMRNKRYQIRRLLEKHQAVIVRQNPGNHDGETALAIALMMEAIYENEPRVHVVTSPNPYWFYGWGNNLIGTCHGDGAKGKDLPLLMAVDAPQLWATSEHGHRVWFVGHIHHKDIKDYPGVTVEYTRTLAAQDAWSHGAGFRSKRTLEAITFHRTNGEVERSTVGLAQVGKSLSAAR